MAKFFIDRPIFAWVIALFIIVMGAVSITQLPIAQYPPVAPPSAALADVAANAAAESARPEMRSADVFIVELPRAAARRRCRSRPPTG